MALSQSLQLLYSTKFISTHIQYLKIILPIVIYTFYRYTNLNSSTMKVFSKSSKTNKSTPTLKQFSRVPHPLTSSKPKSATKIKLFKQIVNENSANTVNKSCFLSHKHRPKTDRHPHSTRDLMALTNKNDEGKQNESNHHKTIFPSAKMISSVICPTNKTEGDRTSVESLQKIESAICYGNILTNKSLNLMQNCSNYTPMEPNPYHLLKPLKPTLKITQKKPSKNLPSNPSNEKENKPSNNTTKDTEVKKMNHYKNTRLNYYKQKAATRKISLCSFNLGRKVGRGRFGCVYIAQEKLTGTIYALKLIDLKQVREQEMQNQIIEQIKLQMFMNHPNVLKMYGCFRDDEQLCMILEYAEDRCLFNKLGKIIEETTVAYYTRQMIGALKYCHSENVLHRDLKPENILISFGVAKLADFGWAAYAPKYKRSTFCGTLDYVPPEILRGDQYDEKVDIWSLGVLIYEMAVGRAPFECASIDPSHTERKTMSKIMEGDLQVPISVSGQLQSLINSILTTQPWRRLSLEEIECSQWMKAHQQEGFQTDKVIKEFWLGHNYSMIR